MDLSRGVSRWTTADEVDLGHLVSLTVDHSPQTQLMDSDLTLCVLSFHKKSIFKVSDFTFDTEVQKFKAKVELFFKYRAALFARCE